jgi:hypothetical protein
MVLDTASRVSEEAKAEALEAEQPAPEVAEAREPVRTERGELLSPQLLATLRTVIPVAWLLGAIAAGFVWGIQIVLLVLAAGALTLVITLMWSSVQSLTGGTPLGFEEALSLGAPSKVEEEKRAVLRALKDLEYERGVGKISPEDYAELLAKYRAHAKRLIQSVDEALGPAREEVEQAIEQRLERLGLTKEPENTAAPLQPEHQPEPEQPATGYGLPASGAAASPEPEARSPKPEPSKETP